MPRWSIIVTTYKRPEQLRETLDKILAATKGVDAEILIADDDPGRSGCPGPERFDLVRYHCNPTNLGTVANVNAAIARSKGEMIHWCADDDWPDLAFYESMDRPLLDVVHCGYRNHLPDGSVWQGPMMSNAPGCLTATAHAVRMMFGNPTHMVATVFSRAIWQLAGGFDPRFPLLHDWHFLIKAAVLGPVGFIPERLANYTQQPASLTGTADPAAFEAEKQAMYADIHEFAARNAR